MWVKSFLITHVKAFDRIFRANLLSHQPISVYMYNKIVHKIHTLHTRVEKVCCNFQEKKKNLFVLQTF